MQIETKGIYKSQKIEILSNRLFITRKNWFKHLEYEISFDNIETIKTVRRELNRDLIAAGFFLFFIGVAINVGGGTIIFAFISIISILLILIGLITKKGTITINVYTGDPIILDFKKHNENQIRDFADTIIDKTKSYLITKYSRIDKDLPIDNQLNSIEYLRSNDLIDETKFVELKNILLGKNSEKKPTGFK